MMELTPDMDKKDQLLHNADLLVAEFLAGLSAFLWLHHVVSYVFLRSTFLRLNNIYRFRQFIVCALHDRFIRAAGVLLIA